ncbi:MAG: uracil-DNA glycosylase family protein [Tannerellaceae bacterium]|jgi:G:T/U-mismatch repair DNA glycosylase|nr:uracil-DNA glycosylase family protein [Tannerellaceae bacterium]
MEKHPLPPFFPPAASLLMLGSFPPPRERWKMDFYYPNIQNDMWRIFGHIFFGDRSRFLATDGKAFREADIRAFLAEKGIAIWDTAMEVIRQKENASDKYLDILRPIDLQQTLADLPLCSAIAITGQKAMDTLLSIIPADEPRIGEYAEAVYCRRSLRIYRMPSSSRAYPRPLEEKAAAYERMFRDMGMIH